MIRALLAFAAGAALSGASAAPLAAPADEIDTIVAVVRSPASTEARVVTLSRLEDETRIALVSRGGVLAAAQRLDPSALSSGLEWLVDELLLSDDAARLQLFDGDAGADAAGELARFRARFERASDYHAFLRRWNLSEEDVAAVLARTARVRRYVDTRVSHAAQVSEGELKAWTDAHGGDRAAARARLVEERTAAEVRALIQDLRSRAEIRYLSGFGEPFRGEAR